MKFDKFVRCSLIACVKKASHLVLTTKLMKLTKYGLNVALQRVYEVLVAIFFNRLVI